MPLPIKITLAAARVNAGFTQLYIAEEMGVSTNTVIAWEKGKHKIRKAQLHMFCDLCSIPVDNIRLPLPARFKERESKG